MRRLLLSLAGIGLLTWSANADRVIMKDGTVYKGKILIDSSKGVVIGNPPFDPNQYLLKSQDIDKIIYEQYHQPPPAQRRRGFLLETHVTGYAFSSSDLSLNPAAGLDINGGIRIHPLFEIDGGLQWIPSVSASEGSLSISNSTASRTYTVFSRWDGQVLGRYYPLGNQHTWTIEPYITGGYEWSHLNPKASNDSLSGSGFLVGTGITGPVTTHFFWDIRFLYGPLHYDKVQFQGQKGTIMPTIDQDQYALSTGLCYRY